MLVDDLSAEEQRRFRKVLLDRFPWLGNEEPAEGAETVADLSELYEDLGGDPPHDGPDEDDDSE